MLCKPILYDGKRGRLRNLWFLTFVVSCFILYFSQGLTALDTFDFWGASLIVFVMATIQVIIFGWVFGIERGMQEIRRGAEFKIPTWIGLLIKYILPVYLLAIFGTWLYYELPNRIKEINENTIVRLSVGFMFLATVFLVFLLVTGLKRWRDQGRISASGAFVGDEVRGER